jgi:hypothetical protein
MLLLLTLKRQDYLQKNVFLKTAFYGLDTDPEPEPGP